MSKLDADVIVVAAGAAGLAAAVAAAECGAKVIAFEKASTTGGTGSMGMGPLGVESRRQRLKFLGPTKDEAFRIFMDYTHWQVDARLVRAYFDKAATTIDWLEDMGVEFQSRLVGDRRVPELKLGLVHIVSSVGKCWHPFRTVEGSVPTHVIQMKMGAYHGINVARLHAAGHEAFEPVGV